MTGTGQGAAHRHGRQAWHHDPHHDRHDGHHEHGHHDHHDVEASHAARRLLARPRSFVHDISDFFHRLRWPFYFGHDGFVKRAALVALVLACLGGLATGGLWWRLGAGPINIDLITPWIASAVEGNFGDGFHVTIGGTQIERDAQGRTSVRVRDVVVLDGTKQKVASAPKAEVGISVLGLLTGRVHARSLNLVGAELSVRIEQDGRIVIFAGEDTAPIATADKPPRIGTTPGASSSPQSPSPASGADGKSAGEKSMAGLLSAIAWLDSLSAAGLDGHDLNELGLKNGNLVVDDRQSGKKWTFENISLALARSRGGVALSIGEESTVRPWLLRAAVGPSSNGVRRVDIVADKVSIETMLLAARMNDGTYSANMPVSAQLRGEIGRDGLPTFFTGKIAIGEGTIIDKTIPEFPMTIDRAEINVEWDANRHVLLAPFQVVSGANRITLLSHLEAPNGQTPHWRLGFGGGTILLAGKEGEEPVIFNRVAVGIVFDTDLRRVVLQRADISNGDISIAGSGTYDYSFDEPRLSLGFAGTPMSLSALKRVWPATVAPEVREWILAHAGNGAVRRIDVGVNAPMKNLARHGPPLPEDGLSVEFSSTGVNLRPVGSLPEIREADVRVHANGRSAKIEISRAAMETPQGRKIALSDLVFDVPNMSLSPAPGQAKFRMEGSAAAIAELLAMDRLNEFSGAPVDPESAKGDVVAQVTLGMPLKRDLKKGETNYVVNVDLANFSAEKMVMNQKVEANNLKIVANNQGYQVKGDVRIAGLPANIDYRKPRDGDADLRLQGILDQAAQERFGLDRANTITGSIPVKVVGKIGAGERDLKFAVEADLTNVAINNPLPGLGKAAGKPGKVTLNVVRKPNIFRLEDIAIDSSGTAIRGSAELSPEGELQSVSFPNYAASPGDKASFKAERAKDGVIKVVMRGDVFDSRDFVKDAMAGRSGDNGNKDSQDIDVDVKIGAVMGHHGEALRGLEVKMSRRNGVLKIFNMSAKIGRDAQLIGDLRGQTGGGQVFYVESGDAGAFFRFTDTYARMQGGQMWVAMDPPASDGKQKEGLLNVRDFTIRGEAALDRVVASGPANAQSGVPFSQMRVEFTRSGGTLIVRDGVVRGPVVGATIAGDLDFAANRVQMSGTFVPLYGLNNMFGQIPIVGIFLGGGSNEGLVGVTYEVVGSPGAPVMRVNPISAVAPGLLRKFFEFPNSRKFQQTPDSPQQGR